MYDNVKHNAKKVKCVFEGTCICPNLGKRHTVYFYTILSKHVTPEDSKFCDPGDII